MPSYTLPDLPYDFGALEPHLSASILELHHGKHHASYVKGANQTLEKLHEARAKEDFAHINQLEKNLAFHVSGHVLHSLLWRNMTPDGSRNPAGDLERALVETFGSVEACTKQMNAAAESVQGSGWAALAWEPLARRLVIQQVYDHQGNVGNGSLPLLVIDMWEHAYYLQYENRKADWLAGFWNVVNWDDVARRFAKVRSTDLDL